MYCWSLGVLLVIGDGELRLFERNFQSGKFLRYVLGTKVLIFNLNFYFYLASPLSDFDDDFDLLLLFGET